MLDGLCYLHEEKKITHFDLKPANILIGRSGEAKIADVGIASQLTKTRTARGVNAYKTFAPAMYTEYYSAPEVVRNQMVCTHAWRGQIPCIGLT